jgi:hypothetical protein
MFTIDSTIDAIQTSKKTFVNTFVLNKDIADALNDFVDAQSDYTKKAVKSGTDTMTTLISESVKVAQSASKIDYASMLAKMTEAFAPSKK